MSDSAGAIEAALEKARREKRGVGVEPASEVAAAEASSEVPALAMSDLEFEPMESSSSPKSMRRGPSPMEKMLSPLALSASSA